MPAEFDSIRSRIRDILLQDWDPSDARLLESAFGAYDVYVDPLYQLIVGGATAEQIATYLHEREQEIMCFPGLGTRRLLPVARKLVKLRG